MEQGANSIRAMKRLVNRLTAPLVMRRRAILIPVLAGILAPPLLGPPPLAHAATASGSLTLKVTILPQMKVEGEGAAGGSALDAGALIADGAPFRIRVRTNAPWRWSVRAEGSSSLLASLRCSYVYQSVKTFGGPLPASGTIALSPTDTNIPGMPLPRGEVIIEGRVTAPSGVARHPLSGVRLVWTIAQEPVNVGQPQTRIISTPVADERRPD